LTFAANGVLFGAWVPRIPQLKDRLGLSAAELGFCLLAPALASVASMAWFGRACARYGSARVVRAALVGFCALACLPGFAANGWLLWLALFAWGLTIGGVDVSMNAQGVTVEHAYRRPVLSSFHASWSLGSLAGVLLGSLAAGARFPVAAQQGALGAFVVAALAVIGRAFLADPPPQPRAPQPPRRSRLALPPPRLILLGVSGVFAMMSEGATGDWSGVLAREHLGAHPAQAGLAYAAFSVTMTGGRMAGDRLVGWLGRQRAIASITIIGAASLAAGLASNTLVGAVAGFAGLGLGLSAMVPVLFSTAADGAPAAGPAIAVVSTLGYSGFLVGPTVIGLVAQASSVASAMWLLPGFTAAGGALGVVAVRMTGRAADQPRSWRQNTVHSRHGEDGAARLAVDPAAESHHRTSRSD